MARYVYRCGECQKTFEVEKSMDRAAEPAACPTCGRAGERVFTAPGIAIKGAPVASAPEPASGHDCSGCCHSGECGLD